MVYTPGRDTWACLAITPPQEHQGLPWERGETRCVGEAACMGQTSPDGPRRNSSIPGTIRGVVL
ncbi:hypothetical protein JW933_05165 [candidate division FCPU426 bacterium]|nr:hypothetical protein [candidate division FCPU426 bacterium]